MDFAQSKIIFASFLLALLTAAIAPQQAYAQELNVNVQVDRSRINSASLTYMNNFGDQIEAYLNQFNWVDIAFEDHERLDANFQIILQAVDNNYNFEASLIIQSQRPIYNSLRRTTLFLHNDESWIFNYSPNRGLVHDELQFDTITTLLDFYAYLLLGIDFDSFSELGGTPYYIEAQNLVSLAQTTGSAGWSRTSGNRRNRTQLVADLLNPNFEPFRRALYHYHRLGVDQFLDQPDEARQQVLNALEMIGEAQENTTTNLLFDIFFNAKYREIVSIFEDADTGVRLRAYNLLSEIDQSHLSEYDKLQ